LSGTGGSEDRDSSTGCGPDPGNRITLQRGYGGKRVAEAVAGDAGRPPRLARIREAGISDRM
jgi:hypothetical protein